MTEGPYIIFEFDANDFLSNHNQHITEVRLATTYLFFTAGKKSKAKAKIRAFDIEAIVSDYGKGIKRLALDHCTLEGVHELK